jgi:Fe-S oxidoreductase
MRQAIFGVLLLAAFGAFGWTLNRFTRFMLKGRPTRGAFDSWGARVGDVLTYFLGQKSVFREIASAHHPFIYWGFLVICLGTLELMIQGLIPSFSYALFGSAINVAFKAVLDLTNAVVLLIMVWSFFRRVVIRPPLIPLSADAALILSLISTLCITHFLMHGAGMVTSDAVHGYMPVSAGVAGFLRGMDRGSAGLVHELNWWIHMGVVLFFLNYIPYSKHIHILGSLPNILLRNRGQRGVMPKRDLENEKDWGVACYERFDWKSLLDSYACTECARCTNNCPAWATDKPLSPMQLIHDIRDEMRARGAKLIHLTPGIDPTAEEGGESGEAAGGEGKGGTPKPTPRDLAIVKQLKEAEPMVGSRIKDETLWSCVTCGACEAVCPVFIEHPMKIVEMRSHLVLAESRMPSELTRVFKGIENNMNPWGIGSDQRMDWAEGLDLPVMADKGSAEYLVWIGCAGSFDDRAKKISRAWVQLLQRAGVDFAVLGLEEGCTGDPARRAGNEFLFQMTAESTIETLKQYQVKKILVTCPHCYHSFKNEYPQFGGEYEVWHHTQFLQKLLAEGKLQPSRMLTDGLTYHDSCYLGRWNDIYDPPRAILAQLAGGKAPIEMGRTGYKSFCCGAGGARMWMEEAPPRINENRTREALATGAKTIATACPFCIVMLTDGVKAANREEEVRVLDVAEVVFASLPPPAGESQAKAAGP